MPERRQRVHTVRQQIQVIVGQAELMTLAKTDVERKKSLEMIKRAVMRIEHVLELVIADIQDAEDKGGDD